MTKKRKASQGRKKSPAKKISKTGRQPVAEKKRRRAKPATKKDLLKKLLEEMTDLGMYRLPLRHKGRDFYFEFPFTELSGFMNIHRSGFYLINKMRKKKKKKVKVAAVPKPGMTGSGRATDVIDPVEEWVDLEGHWTNGMMTPWSLAGIPAFDEQTLINSMLVPRCELLLTDLRYRQRAGLVNSKGILTAAGRKGMHGKSKKWARVWNEVTEGSRARTAKIIDAEPPKEPIFYPAFYSEARCPLCACDLSGRFSKKVRARLLKTAKDKDPFLHKCPLCRKIFLIYPEQMAKTKVRIG